MRIIDLDFYADKGGSIFLGYAGEHLSTVLNFHMPAEFSKDNCLYLVNFETDDGQVLGGSTPQESQTVGEPTADSLIAFRADRDSNIVKYYVPNTVVGATAHTGKFQLSVYGLDATNNNYKLLGYSTQFSYVIDNAINIGTSVNFSEDFIAALDDLLSAIANIGDFSELSQEYTDLVDRISAVLSNIEDNKINKNKAIKYTSTNILNDCVEPGTIYRYIETVNGNLNGLATGDYTIIPSYIAGTGNLAQYIFSTTGAIYCRRRTLKNGSYVYTIEKLTEKLNPDDETTREIIVHAVEEYLDEHGVDLAGAEKTTNKANSFTESDADDTHYPTTLAVKNYVAAVIGGIENAAY